MQWIKDIANGLIEHYGTRDVYELVDCLDIKLLKKHLCNNVNGRFFRDSTGNEYIFISEEVLPEEEKSIIAHEIGHAILHTNLSTVFNTSDFLQVKNKKELQADKFAAELLISDDIDIHEFEDMTTKEISNYLEVCEELIEYKFKNLKGW